MLEYPKLKAVKPLDGYRLFLVFGDGGDLRDDGELRVYNFRPNLSHKYYASLADVEKFNKVGVKDGDIEWESGQDFCPHTLYDGSVSV